jgi:hypothetical protein
VPVIEVDAAVALPETEDEQEAYGLSNPPAGTEMEN